MPWSIAKFFSIVIFIVMMIFFFFWMSNQIGDLSLFFGFRTSHTVANDIANVITSTGSVPGNDVRVTYTIFKGSTSQFKYEVDVSNKLVCVTSYTGADITSDVRATTDCATHIYDPDRDYSCKMSTGGTLVFEKKIDKDGKSVLSIPTGCGV